MLDDAIRVVPLGEFHFTENAESLLCVLRQAIREVPEGCYVDGGAARNCYGRGGREAAATRHQHSRRRNSVQLSSSTTAVGTSLR